MNTILYFKAFHIFSFVAWFAGLFYLVRIFVYHREALAQRQPEGAILVKQFKLMERRVYKIICTPAMMLTWIFGFSMLYIHGWDWLLVSQWMQIKLGLLALLTGYHFYCQRIIKALGMDKKSFNSFQFRLLNEVPTLFLLSIVLLAVLKNGMDFLYAFFGMIAFGFFLYLAAKLYKNAREGKDEAQN